MQERNSAHPKTPYFFSQALFYATALPFLMGALVLAFSYLYPNPQGHFTDTNPIRFTINLLAAIHVPLTLYLFFDPVIRSRIYSNKILFMLIPAIILLGCLLLFTASTEARASKSAYPLAGMVVLFIAWSFWHFGKQNIGVYSYYSLGSGRRMRPIEKRLIYASAALGIVAALIQGFSTYVPLYSTYQFFLPLAPYVKFATASGRILQYALSAFSLFYVLLHARRLGFKASLILLIATSYFLPVYMSAHLRDLRWLEFFAAINIGHGLQYIAFLLFHSITIQQGRRRSIMIRGISVPGMTLMLIGLGIVMCEIYGYHIVTGLIDMSWLATPEYRTSLTDGLANGILLNHFWFDSFFWRFTHPSSRQWLLERYSFMFPAKTASA